MRRSLQAVVLGLSLLSPQADAAEIRLPDPNVIGDDVEAPRRQDLARGKLSIATIEAAIKRGEQAGKGFLDLPLGELLADGRSFRLARDFTYVDLRGTRWTVPKGYVTNGASVPWQLWSLGLAPFSGPYRNAAIVHDYLCEKRRTKLSLQTHLLFYEGMRVGGVAENKATTMFNFVALFGPSWSETRNPGPTACVPDPIRENTCMEPLDPRRCYLIRSEAEQTPEMGEILRDMETGTITPEAASAKLEKLRVTYVYTRTPTICSQ